MLSSLQNFSAWRLQELSKLVLCVQLQLKKYKKLEVKSCGSSPKDDQVEVNGEILTESSLANLRRSYGISTSSKQEKTFKRLVEDFKANSFSCFKGSNGKMRVGRASRRDYASSAEVSHIPHQPWLHGLHAHRARSDKHHRDHQWKVVAHVSFVLLSHKSSDEVKRLWCNDHGRQQDWLFVVPLNLKVQFDLLTKELVAFCALGCNKVEQRACPKWPNSQNQFFVSKDWRVTWSGRLVKLVSAFRRARFLDPQIVHCIWFDTCQMAVSVVELGRS